MQHQKIIVIGASTGGIEAIKSFIGNLPQDLNASIFMVWHVAPSAGALLPRVINQLQGLPAALAMDNETIQSGRIYVAPADRHLLIEKNIIRVTHGPKENLFRPAIDPLFRSAAYSYGSRVIGIVLSGALDDGTAGLWAIKRRGGITVVQEPSDAAVPSMPLNALDAVSIDHCIPASGMAELLVNLCNGRHVVDSGPEEPPRNEQEDSATSLEIKIAMEQSVDDDKLMAIGEPSKFACPECHGVLTAVKEGNRTRFRCHTGHAYSPESLLAALSTTTENVLWNAVRILEERKFLLNDLGNHFLSRNQPLLSATFFERCTKAGDKAEQIRKVIYGAEE